MDVVSGTYQRFGTPHLRVNVDPTPVDTALYIPRPRTYIFLREHLQMIVDHRILRSKDAEEDSLASKNYVKFHGPWHELCVKT